MATATCDPEATREVAIRAVMADDELYDDLQFFQFAWPTKEDASFAAREAELNVIDYDIIETCRGVRDRWVVVVSHDTEAGRRAARAAARLCAELKAHKVVIWEVSGYGSDYPTLRDWGGRYSLINTLAMERSSKYRSFVAFVIDPRGERPGFEGEPRAIGSELAEVPAMEPEMIPASLRAWCLDIADRIWCPLEYVATPMVVMLGGVIGRRLAIRPKRHDDWKVVPNLWGAIVGAPGSLKTPAIEEVRRPLKLLDLDEQERYDREAGDHREAAVVSQATRAAARKAVEAAARKGMDRDRLRELAREAVEGQADRPPEMRRHFLNDVTNEKLGELMAQEVNANGLILFRDELVGFFRSLDRQGHEADRSFFLEAWNGTGSFTFDRIGRGTVHIPHACLSLFGGIQPGPLASYLRGAFSGEECDGFIQRFQVLMYPDPLAGFLNVDRPPDLRARARATAIFRALDALDPARRGVLADDESSIPCLRFDDDAQALFNEWRGELEDRLRSGTLPALMESHLSKYRSLMPAMALIFHLVETIEGGTLGPVTLSAAEMAAAWCDLLERHASRVYRAASEGDPDAAIRLSERMAGSLPDPFTARDVYRKNWSGLTSHEEVRAALAILEDRNWVRSVEIPTTERGGRPTEIYWKNPRLIAREEARS